MVKRREILFAQVILVCDAIVLLASCLAAYLIRDGLLSPHFGPLSHYAGYKWIIWIILPAWFVSLWRFNLYRPSSHKSSGAIMLSLLKAQALAGLILLSAMYLTMSEYVSRLFLETFLLISWIVLLGERILVRLALHTHAKWRRAQRAWQVLVVSDERHFEGYLELLRANPHWGVKVVGRVDPPRSLPTNGDITNGAEAETCDRWAGLFRTDCIDEVVAVSPWQDAGGFDGLAEACAERGVVFRILVQMPPRAVGTYHVDDVGNGSYVVSLETVPQQYPLLLIKRALDIVGAAVGLALCGTVYPLYALWLRLRAPGSVLYRQLRLGRNGRPFMIYKFRTMYPDADQRFRELLDRNEMRGPIFKIKDDPRIIPGGRFMRRTHLDELPQFWNVLRGEMSLVGTRPPTPDEAASYRNHHFRRLSMRPGLTGLWQLNGNGAVADFEDIVELDCRYIDSWSLWLDAKIIAKTSVKTLSGQGW